MKPIISSSWPKSGSANHEKPPKSWPLLAEKKVVSAHRTPDLMFRHEELAVVASRFSSVLRGAAPTSMVAGQTTLPVIGTRQITCSQWLTFAYSIVQMPGGKASNYGHCEAGATNAALLPSAFQ